MLGNYENFDEYLQASMNAFMQASTNVPKETIKHDTAENAKVEGSTNRMAPSIGVTLPTDQILNMTQSKSPAETS